MDTLLVNGDYYPGPGGLPTAVNGDAELLQRALIRLSLRRGMVRGAPRLGSELHKLGSAAGRPLDRLALAYAQEALAPMPELNVQSVEVARDGADGLTVAVTAGIRDQSYRLEVAIT